MTVEITSFLGWLFDWLKSTIISLSCFPCQAAEQNLRVKIEREKDEDAARNEMQLSILSENLTTVRSDLSSATQKLEEVTRINEELKGEKLGKYVFEIMKWIIFVTEVRLKLIKFKLL